MFQNQWYLYQELILISHELIGGARVLNAMGQRNQQHPSKPHENLLSRGIPDGHNRNKLEDHYDGVMEQNVPVFCKQCTIIMKLFNSDWVMR